jgi:hypothetical protein
MNPYLKVLMPLIAATIGALIVAIGWWVTGTMNRANNIALKRLDYRIKALESFLPVWSEIEKDDNALEKPEVKAKLAGARTSFQLYGTKGDIDVLEALVTAIERRDVPAYNRALQAILLSLGRGCAMSSEPTHNRR